MFLCSFSTWIIYEAIDVLHLHTSINADLDIQHVFSSFHGRSSSGQPSVLAWGICTLYKSLNVLQRCTCFASEAHLTLRIYFAVTHHNSFHITFQLFPSYRQSLCIYVRSIQQFFLTCKMFFKKSWGTNCTHLARFSFIYLEGSYGILRKLRNMILFCLASQQPST